uniref:C-type lectin domain-containing protein n=1 Tax=Fundulus heteroclitus TaxID=8078 RepID=A0A3Q2NSB1_FUNHE
NVLFCFYIYSYFWLTKIILPTLPLNSVVGQCPGFCLGSCSKFPLRKYYYVEMPSTWFEAQQYCREHYTDLATFENIEDFNRLEATFSYSFAWIGLWDDPNSWKNKMGNESNSWRWSATGETSKTGYKSWTSGNPDFWAGKEICVNIRYDGRWADVTCGGQRYFICENGEKIFF